MRKIALATSQEYSELSRDDKNVLNKLLDWGVDVEPIVWDTKDIAWNQYDAVFIRSCWDYHLRYDDFFKWIERLAQREVAIFNPPETLRWNSTKTYLKEMAEKGVDVIPTVWKTREDSIDLEQIIQENSWERAVVKPVVSANANETWISNADSPEENRQRIAAMFEKHGTIMIQKYLEQIVKRGEWAFIFFDNVYSHSVLKRPGQGDFRVQEDHGGAIRSKKPPRHLIEQAQKVISQTPSGCLYARVDGVEVNNKLWLMELELIEPSLYLKYHPKAPERFAEAILRRMNALHSMEAQTRPLSANGAPEISGVQIGD